MGFWSKVFQGAKYSRKQSVPGCKVCYGVKSTEEQSVPGSKMCWIAKDSKKQKGSKWQRVFRSKVCWRVNCDFAKCVGLQSVLCFWEAKCSQGVKCVLVQSVHQPLEEHITSASYQDKQKPFRNYPKRPHLQIKLDENHTVKALVDTGSSISIGDSSLIRHLKK